MARATDSKPLSINFEEKTSGNHVYKDIWTPEVGEMLSCEGEPTNTHDINARSYKIRRSR